jgi:hypothetical protein
MKHNYVFNIKLTQAGITRKPLRLSNTLKGADMGDEYYVLKVGHIYTPYVEGKAL